MPVSWAQRYATLRANAIQVLAALTTLGIDDVAQPDLAAALALDESALPATITALRRAGWIEACPDGAGPRLVEAARLWLLSEPTAHPTNIETATIAQRYLDHHRDRLDRDRHDPAELGEWANSHKDSIVRAIRSATQAGLHRAAADLASAAWAVAHHVVDSAWWQELARHGERAAVEARDPHALMALLNSSAAVYAGAEDFRQAERQQARVTRLLDKMRGPQLDEAGYQTLIVVNLTSRIDLYRRWGRFCRAMDLLLELADEHQRAGNLIGVGETVLELGELHLAVGQADEAVIYLERADQILTDRPGDMAAPVTHARVLEQRGRAEWRLGHPIRARRRFTRALTLLGDHDPASVARLRCLLATPRTSAELPPDDTDAACTRPAGQPVDRNPESLLNA